MTASDQPLWVPGDTRRRQAKLTEFWRQLEKEQLPLSVPHVSPPSLEAGYEALHRWSVENRAAFWEALWHHFRVRGTYENSQVLRDGDAMPGARWFPGARLNFAENLLAAGDDHDPALVEYREDGRRRQLSYGELRRQSAHLAGYLRSVGVGPGDRVAGFLPNGAEAVLGMLAAARLGAIWSSCSPDFGRRGVLERFGQIEPKVLIGTNGYRYNGKLLDTRERVTDLVESLPGLACWIAVDDQVEFPWEPHPNQTAWDYALEVEPDHEFERVAFDDPLYILYSSGTTGAPKCIVHGVGGTLLQHLKELVLHTDLQVGDGIFYYTTCGWMMWNWLASSLAVGAKVLLYDGSPFTGGRDRLWRIATEERLRVFGASAKYYAACEKAGLRPGSSHDLSALDTLLSTGSPLAHESFDYLYREVAEDLCLASISGGTDIVSCFALGNPLLPVYRGELQCLGLGMDVAFLDEDGAELPNGKGELVCRTPFPSMPVGFWNDPDGERYRSAYFDRFHGIWAHGDFGELREHPAREGLPEQRGVIIHGRADAVLNPGGVRIGTAEIYRQVEAVDEVLEAIAVGQEWHGDVRVVLFVTLQSGQRLDEVLQDKIRKTIRRNTTPRHVPAKILQVPDIPRTISGKIVELAVRQVIHGEKVANKAALANPEALEYFANREELES